MLNDTKNQTRLRRAKELLASRRIAEGEARWALGSAIAETKRARERYTELFIEEEKAEVARRNDLLGANLGENGCGF